MKAIGGREAAALTLSLFLVSVAGTSVAQAASGPITLRYAHPGGPGTSQYRFAQEFSALVEKKTEGRVKIKVFPSSQLGGANEIIGGVKLGSIHLAHNDFAAAALLLPELAVFNVPFLYRDPAHALRASTPATSPVLAEMNERLIRESGVRVLGSFFYGTRHLSENKPIYSPKDLRGRRIRAVPFPLWISMIQGMGALPTPVDVTELSTALLTGIVDGQENPLTMFYNNNLSDMQRCVMLTGHMIATLAVLANEKAWQGVPAQDRRLVEEAAHEIGLASVAWGEAEEIDLRERIAKRGTRFIGPAEGLDLRAFRESVSASVRARFPHWAAAIQRIEAIQ